MLIELCLIMPARLSDMLVVLTQLMRPLVTALVRHCNILQTTLKEFVYLGCSVCMIVHIASFHQLALCLAGPFSWMLLVCRDLPATRQMWSTGHLYVQQSPQLCSVVSLSGHTPLQVKMALWDACGAVCEA